jgi:gentisate 1,2-dioxygenase
VLPAADHRLPHAAAAPREKTRARRRICPTNYHVVEGAGYSMVGGQRLDWEDKDVFTVPTWTFYEHVNSGDRPVFCSASVTRR